MEKNLYAKKYGMFPKENTERDTGNSRYLKHCYLKHCNLKHCYLKVPSLPI